MNVKYLNTGIRLWLVFPVLVIFFTALAGYQLSLVAQEQLIFPELVNILDP